MLRNTVYIQFFLCDNKYDSSSCFIQIIVFEIIKYFSHVYDFVSTVALFLICITQFLCLKT
jgi:hypothetical protein